jgi:integrase
MPAKYKKRADGRYLVQILKGYGLDGNPKYKNVYAKTISELEKKVATVRDEIEKGIHIDSSGLTLEQWAVRWIDLYKQNVAYNTRRMYEIVLKAHILPALGVYRLRDLKPHHAQELLNKLASDDKKRTAEQVQITLRQLLTQAVKNEYIHRNIMDAVQPIRCEKPKKRALTEEEISYVLNVDLPLKEKTFVILLLTTGLRRGEALALTPGDIDMKSRKITVNKTVITVKNQMEIKESPKSAAGNRDVPITDELYTYLAQYLPTLKSLILFPTAQNKLMTHTAFRCMWSKIMNAMNVAAGGTNGKVRVIKIAGDITPHTFRHTFATLLYEAGVDVKAAQYLLGHSSIIVTQDIYTKLSDKKKEVEMSKFNSFMVSFIQSKISQQDGATGKKALQ